MDGSRGDHILSVGGQHIDPHERKIENKLIFLAGIIFVSHIFKATKMIAADDARSRDHS